MLNGLQTNHDAPGFMRLLKSLCDGTVFVSVVPVQRGPANDVLISINHPVAFLPRHDWSCTEGSRGQNALGFAGSTNSGNLAGWSGVQADNLKVSNARRDRESKLEFERRVAP